MWVNTINLKIIDFQVDRVEKSLLTTVLFVSIIYRKWYLERALIDILPFAVASLQAHYQQRIRDL